MGAPRAGPPSPTSRGPRRGGSRRGRGGAAPAALLVAAAAVAYLTPFLSAGWVSGPSLLRQRGRARRPRARRASDPGGSQGEAKRSLEDLEVGDERGSLEDLEVGEAKRSLEDLEVGEIVDGTVNFISKLGVSVDIGCERSAFLSAPRKEAFELKKGTELQGLTVEKIRRDRGYVLVSAPGLPKLTLLDDMQEGDSVDGRVAVVESKDCLVDVGAEKLALLRGPKSEVRKLAVDEELKGMQVKAVDPKKNTLMVTFSGLSELVADRQKNGTQDVEVGQARKGKVVVKSLFSGVWLDIGRKTRARVAGASPEMLDLLRPGEWLDVVVQSVDVEAGRAEVGMPNIEEHVTGRNATQRVEVKDLQVGSILPARVVDAHDPRNVFFDFGAAAEGKMTRGFDMGKGFVDRLRRMQITGKKIKVRLDTVDVDSGKVEVSPIKEEKKGDPSS